MANEVVPRKPVEVVHGELQISLLEVLVRHAVKTGDLPIIYSEEGWVTRTEYGRDVPRRRAPDNLILDVKDFLLHLL